MNLKDMIAKLTQLSEATKETPTGKIHKAEPGGYGRKLDTDEEGDEKKEKKPEVKRGRGRPKKGADSETGEVKTYSGAKDLQSFMIGNLPKGKLPGKASKKHSLKEYIEEAEQVTIEPAKQNTQVIKQGNKVLGSVENPQLAAQIKQSIGKGEMSLAGNELGEEAEDYSAKKARAGKDIGKPGKNFAKIAKAAAQRYGSKKSGEKVAGAVLAKLRAKTNEADQPPQGSLASPLTFEGKKEKPDFLDLDKDGNKKESMKKAAQDKKKVDEGMEHKLKAARHAGKAHALAKEGYNCRYDDMEEARSYHEGYKEGLDECYGQMPVQGIAVVGESPAATVPGMADQEMGEGNAFTAALAKTPHGGKFSVGGKTFTDRTNYDAKVDEMAFESWNNQLSALLESKEDVSEGMTVSISKGQQGAPDSVSVTAQDGEADELLGLIKSAGLGLFADEKQNGYGAPTGDVSAPGGIDVVDDNEGMMALIKRMSGADSADYEEEGGHEESCGTCGEAQCKCDHEMVDEVESEDQMTYQMAEESPQEAGQEEEEETTASENAEAAEDQAGAAYDASQNLDEVSDELKGAVRDQRKAAHASALSTAKQKDDSASWNQVSKAADKLNRNTQLNYGKHVTNAPVRALDEVSDELKGAVRDQRKAAHASALSTAKQKDDKASWDQVSKSADKLNRNTQLNYGKHVTNKPMRAIEESTKLDEWANEAGQKGTDASFEADIDFMMNVISSGLNKRKSTGQTTVPVIAGQEDRMKAEETTDINESVSDWKKLAGI